MQNYVSTLTAQAQATKGHTAQVALNARLVTGLKSRQEVEQRGDGSVGSAAEYERLSHEMVGTEELLRDEMRHNHIRHDALDLVERTPDEIHQTVLTDGFFEEKERPGLTRLDRVFPICHDVLAAMNVLENALQA